MLGNDRFSSIHAEIQKGRDLDSNIPNWEFGSYLGLKSTSFDCSMLRKDLYAEYESYEAKERTRTVNSIVV